MKFRIITILVLVSLISCKKSESLPNKFVGTWYDTEYIIPSRSTLKINKDSTFKYESAGCDWRVISKGNWKIVGDSIELNSTSSDTCYKMFPFVNCKPFETRRRKDVLTSPNCKPENNALFLIFAKEKFYIKDDSLVYKLRPSSSCPDTLKIIFAKTEKIRR
ncbi:hypothetical protein Flavo103_36570 [Flavobacterium collinsii]|uniref:hypothetical protein n=1 Tax=Flavobacterium collinsii TaxID=1114861 RepID=UPI0022CD1257|nr:hypothetical protein [Flavobacterium collinsii]GIQ60521.1 hypothetical protein Flavo103_36570 [Flavobacterium collinsii]